MASPPESPVRATIRARYGCEARLVETVRVVARIDWEDTWSGDVEIHELLDGSVGPRCFAWKEDASGATTVVLQSRSVDCARSAIRHGLVEPRRRARKEARTRVLQGLYVIGYCLAIAISGVVSGDPYLVGFVAFGGILALLLVRPWRGLRSRRKDRRRREVSRIFH